MSRRVRGPEALAVRKIKWATIRLVAGNQQKQFYCFLEEVDHDTPPIASPQGTVLIGKYLVISSPVASVVYSGKGVKGYKSIRVRFLSQ